MNKNLYFSRLPFCSHDGQVRYCVAGQMVDAGDEHDLKTLIEDEARTVLSKLPFCADCLGTLAWAEDLYGDGARRCMQCGSVYVVAQAGQADPDISRR